MKHAAATTAAGEAIVHLRRRGTVRHVQAASADATYVLCRRREVTVAVARDPGMGDVLDVDLVDSESAEALRPFITRLQTEFDLEALLGDDQKSYKLLSDELGLEHGVCRAHVNALQARSETSNCIQLRHLHRAGGALHAWGHQCAGHRAVDGRARAAEGRDQARPNVRAEVRDFVSLGTEPARGSQAHALIVNLLHLEQPAISLQEAHRVLGEGGTLAVVYWRSDIPTLRGSSLAIWPRPEDCRV